MLDINNIGAAITAAVDDLVANTPNAAKAVKKAKADKTKTVITRDAGDYWVTGDTWTFDGMEATEVPSKREGQKVYRDDTGAKAFPRSLSFVALTVMSSEQLVSTTEVAVPEEEVVLVPELVPTAQELDTKIRTTADRINHDWTEFADLVTQAESQNIHTELGFASWPAYIADVVQTNLPTVAKDVEARQALVAIMTGHGMSVRVQAEALGTSKSAVSRDQVALSQSGTVTAPPTVTTRTGKKQARPDRKQPTPTLPPYTGTDRPWLSAVPDPKPEPSKAEQGAARRQLEVAEVSALVRGISVNVTNLMDEMAGTRPGIASPLPSEKRLVLEGLMTEWAKLQNVFGPVGELAANMGMVLPEWWPIQPGESRLIPADQVPSWWDSEVSE
jgi:hypothetical protein